jgi:hypothetical protein
MRSTTIRRSIRYLTAATAMVFLACTGGNGNENGSEPIAASTARPNSLSDLLGNLKIAWDRRLLKQQTFWTNDNLLRFFDGVKVTWDPQIAQLDPSWSLERGLTDQDGRMVVYTGLLQNPVEVQRGHYTEPASVYPSRTETSGSITLSFGPDSTVTWGKVKSLFGGDVNYEGLPPQPISHNRDGRTVLVDSWDYAVRANILECYRGPEALPERMSPFEYDEICFFLKIVNFGKSVTKVTSVRPDRVEGTGRRYCSGPADSRTVRSHPDVLLSAGS